MKARWGDSRVLVNYGGTEWKLPQQLYADDAVLLVTVYHIKSWKGWWVDLIMCIGGGY